MTDPVLADIFRMSKHLLTKAEHRGLTIGVAESCTGGLLGAAITSLPGSSTVFHGGFMTYSNRLKEELLGVSPETLTQYGAVSAQTAREMALGAKRGLGVDLALSITGVAGPGGGTKDKPVGTVCFGIATQDGISTETQHFANMTRNRVRDHAVIHALKLLRVAAERR